MTKSSWYGGHNLSILPARVEPLGAVQSYSRCWTAKLHRRFSQGRVVFVETITPCLSGPHFANGFHCSGEDSCRKMCRNTQVRRPTLARPHSFHNCSPIERHGRCHHPSAASQCVPAAHPEPETVECKSTQPKTVSYERPRCWFSIYKREWSRTMKEIWIWRGNLTAEMTIEDTPIFISRESWRWF